LTSERSITRIAVDDVMAAAETLRNATTKLHI